MVIPRELCLVHHYAAVFVDLLKVIYCVNVLDAFSNICYRMLGLDFMMAYFCDEIISIVIRIGWVIILPLFTVLLSHYHKYLLCYLCVKQY